MGLTKVDTMFIIGNGFDLNLGYKTSYLDFLQSSEFKEIVERRDILAQYLMELSAYNDKWIDIELELGKISKKNRSKFGIDLRNMNFKESHEILCNSLKEYLKRVTENRGKDIKKTESFLVMKKWSGESNYVLNFNYTNTADKIIEDTSLRIHEINHVHGSLDCDIVFGVEDNADIQREHAFLYKSCSPGRCVRDMYNSMYIADKIVFFGYSLGKTDHSYFKDFFQNQSVRSCKKKMLVFYYYNDSDRDNLKMQLMELTDYKLSQLDMFNSVYLLPISDLSLK